MTGLMETAMERDPDVSIFVTLQVCMSYCDTGFDMVGNTTVLLCDEAPSTSAAWPWGGRMHFLPGSVYTDSYMTPTHFIICNLIRESSKIDQT